MTCGRSQRSFTPCGGRWSRWGWSRVGLETPSADGTFGLQWANQDGGGATGPTLKKGSWMRVGVGS